MHTVHEPRKSRAADIQTCESSNVVRLADLETGGTPASL
jgi:hypothetical protein